MNYRNKQAMEKIPEWFKHLNSSEDENGLLLSEIDVKTPGLYLLGHEKNKKGCMVLNYDRGYIIILLYKYSPLVVRKAYRNQEKDDLIIDHNFSLKPMMGIAYVIEEILKEKIKDIEASCPHCGASNCEFWNGFEGFGNEGCNYIGLPKFRNRAESLILSILW